MTIWSEITLGGGGGKGTQGSYEFVEYHMAMSLTFVAKAVTDPKNWIRVRQA